MAQKKKKSVLENSLLLQSSARTAGIRESCDQCYSDMQLDNSSCFGLIKENYVEQYRFHRQLYPTQKLQGQRDMERSEGMCSTWLKRDWYGKRKFPKGQFPSSVIKWP